VARPKLKSDDEVLAAAGRVLLEVGPHAATLAAVAEAAGLAPATLVQRFGSKQGLLRAFARRAAAQATAPFVAARAREPSPLRALRAGLFASARELGERRRFINSLSLLLLDIQDRQLRRAAATYADQVEAQLCQLLEAAIDAGELPRTDPAARARLIYATWNGALIQWALRGTGRVEAWLGPVLDDAIGASSAGGTRPDRGARNVRGSRAARTRGRR
jgi:AcrR family transcriptional regulator